MASMDFVYDLMKCLEKDNIDYLLVAVRNGKRKDKADVFYKIKPENVEVIKMVTARVVKELSKKPK